MIVDVVTAHQRWHFTLGANTMPSISVTASETQIHPQLEQQNNHHATSSFTPSLNDARSLFHVCEAHRPREPQSSMQSHRLYSLIVPAATHGNT